ncbi:rRNA-processing protein FCF1 [Physcia stellaris]|nr:rRNA-processing protein FCF1 [Physcia stellaris]
MLKSDEDRERKAEHKIPGTYHIVANPASFAGLEEYRDSQDSSRRNSVSRPSRSPKGRSSSANKPSSSNVDVYEDPETLILGTFEDNVRKMPTLGLLTTQLSKSPTSSLTSHSPATTIFQTARLSSRSDENSPMVESTVQSKADQEIVAFYQNFVRRQLNQVHCDSLGTPSQSENMTFSEVLDRNADNFPPLYHALMAFSALSMAHSQGVQNLSALQHYDKALPYLQNSLRSSIDLSSDGALLTHFLLLLYEIAAAEPRGTNLWSQHLSQLLRIVMLRHELYGRENYSFVIWWTVSIDTHSILTGSGRGDFVKTMLASGILSDPSIAGQASTFDFDNTSTASTAHPGPSVLVFHRSILVLAARLGLLAHEIRYSVAQSYGRQTQASRAEVIQRQHRVEQLRDSLRETWELQAPTFDAMGYCNENVPVHSRGIFEHTYALYHACIIYSHTSMWPNQRLDNGPQPIQETTHSVSRIIQLGHEITSNGFIERKFMVFPLFMAGIASQNPPDHQQVIRLLIAFENQSIGKAMVATRQILETVYEKQREVIMLGANPLMVDWVDTVAERGLQMIDARL